MWNWIGRRRPQRPGQAGDVRGADPRDAGLPHPATTAAAERQLDDLPRGCGWFDSSFELRRGLAVIEHEVFDLSVTLDLHAAGIERGKGCLRRP